MPLSTTALLRTTTWLTLALGTVYAVTLVPGVRPTPGYRPALDWWLNMTVDGLVVLVLVLRVLVDRRDRAAWLFMAAGLVAAFAGSTAYYAHYQHLDPVPSPSWADAGWLLFYGLLAVGLVLRLRTRTRSMPFSLSLDGLIAGLTAAALAENYVGGADVPLGEDGVGTLTTAYPLADLLLLAWWTGARTSTATRSTWGGCWPGCSWSARRWRHCARRSPGPWTWRGSPSWSCPASAASPSWGCCSTAASPGSARSPLSSRWSRACSWSGGRR